MNTLKENKDISKTEARVIQYSKIVMGFIFLIAGCYFMYRSISFYNHFEQVYSQSVQCGQLQPSISPYH